MEEMQNQNYSIAEEFTLPSKGLIYNTKINPVIKLRSMTGRDELKRLAPTNTPLKSLAEIIDGCVVSEKLPISVYDMAFEDYEFLLHKLRLVTYGNDYKIVVTCPDCGEEINTSINLDDLTVNEIDIAKFEDARNILLPRSQKRITLKFQTPRSMEELEMKAKEQKRKTPGANIDFNTFVTLNYLIDKVDGERLNAFELENFINRLPAADLNKILNATNKISNLFGIDNEIVMSCPKCKSEITTFFRFGGEFFRPTEDE